MKPETLLLRQVHPSFVQNGQITSQVFRPTPKDEDKLSVYNGDMIAPADSFAHFINTPNCQSVGVVAITCNDCKNQSLDVIADGKPFPEHAYIDFSGLEKNAIEKKAKIMKRCAQDRGWLFQA